MLFSFFFSFLSHVYIFVYNACSHLNYSTNVYICIWKRNKTWKPIWWSVYMFIYMMFHPMWASSDNDRGKCHDKYINILPNCFLNLISHPFCQISLPMVQETWVQFQVESYQRLKKWYLIPPCLTLSIIRYRSRIKWSKPGKKIVPFPTPWYSS